MCSSPLGLGSLGVSSMVEGVNLRGDYTGNFVHV